MPLIQVKLIEGVFSGSQKAEIVRKLTDTMVSIEGENLRPVTWVVVEEIKGGDWGIGGNPLTAADVKALAAYEASGKEFLATLEKTPESRLLDKVTFFTGPKQMGEVPVGDLLWMTLMDSVHHRGKMSVYIRIAGGKVPSIYGPTADEPWN